MVVLGEPVAECRAAKHLLPQFPPLSPPEAPAAPQGLSQGPPVPVEGGKREKPALRAHFLEQEPLLLGSICAP